MHTPDCVWETKDTITVAVTLCAFIVSEILGVTNHENKYRSVLQVLHGVLDKVVQSLRSGSASDRALINNAVANNTV